MSAEEQKESYSMMEKDFENYERMINERCNKKFDNYDS